MSLTVADDLNMYDSEVQECISILGRLQVKYSTRSASRENLLSLSNEAMDLFAKAGFIATVSVFDEQTLAPKLPPEITIHGRVEAQEFDAERQAWEVKKEVVENEKQAQKFLSQGGTTDQAVDAGATVGEPEIAED